ncbi:MAG: RrF2 family transcriptional regulator [Centipeda sp. (in: firmicutes)]|uniref:RrF2 family transcriptional regulator n=1 Tax=Selenomonas sp. oral taxon 920 TaxID=1884263 RepID=UPI000840A02B|nr:Rrf2 family transcriptional regulator [Selenomonas sp. oral taxon 920]AOH47861.1 Rrf2 family transcriptional regulator [Selenomonas sp. oral taxon 920]
MKISAKGRYGIAAMVYLARNYETSSPITIISISDHLGISKIYLEQVFSLLKRSKLVNSIKGSQGGYQLSRQPRQITAYDILSSIEISLIEKTGAASEKMEPLNHILSRTVFDVLDKSIYETLNGISLEDLLTALNREESNENLMYFI